MLALKKLQDSVKKHGSKKEAKSKDKPAYQQEDVIIPVPWGHIAGVIWYTKRDSVGTVLCLHGLQDNAAAFETLIPLLPDNNKYICLDLPGHGRSSHFPYSLPVDIYKFILTLRSVTTSLRLSRFGLIGHGYSSLIVGLFSALYPESVDKALLIDTAGLPLIPIDKTAAHLRKSMDHFERFISRKPEENHYPSVEDALKNFMKKRKNTLSKKSATILLQRSLTLTPEGYKFNTDPRLVLSSSLIPMLSTEQTKNLMAAHKGTKVLVITRTNHDNMISKAGKEAVESVLSHAESLGVKVHHIEGGNSVHMDHPERVAQLFMPVL